MKTTKISNKRSDEQVLNTVVGGLPLRTNLRAGLAWDDLDDQAAALWGKLSSTVSNATNALTSAATPAKQ